MIELTPAEIARFYSKIKLRGCGLRWDGPVNNHGYGRFEVYRRGKRVRILAHRLMFRLSTGEDPGRSVVRHGCDTPPCLTPDCLTTGTQADNYRDSADRGRANTGGLAAYRAVRDARAAERLVTGDKQCSRCWQVKKLADFPRCSGNVDGCAYWCKTCLRDYRRAS